ncbi:hypothetical protein [Marinobacterium lutimaris]|uniref:hypothetical protein n=1 Tax=Marinobacterium lutimaris TaxID=568106 RepID=UPI0011AFF2C1|nr:hypothetical protein [Marinobacterium lutimaris]
MLKGLNKYSLIMLSVVSFSALAEGKWYENGNLHNADISSWKSASHSNKLATAADWVFISPAIKEKIKSSGSMNTAKPFAQELVKCVSGATDGVNYNGAVTEVAASCMVLMGWLK